MGSGGVRTYHHRGWEMVRLVSDVMEVDVVPGKGGDIVAARWRPLDLNVLWESPWGLRQQGAAPTGGDSLVTAMEQYPGGWQTVFPNAGDAVGQHGIEWGFHGEAWLAPWDWRQIDTDGGCAVELTTRLVRSPFRLVKLIALQGDTVTVSETATNEGGTVIDAMWTHHPAFGAPFLSSDCTVDIEAATFSVDDLRDTRSSDLERGATAAWPLVPGRTGVVDLRVVPPPGADVDRFGYLSQLASGKAAITNSALGIGVVLRWDLATMPYAWFWVEANASAGFPWFKSAYVLAIEPAASWPGQGIDAARQKTGTPVTFAPGQARTATTSLQLLASASTF